MESYKEELFKKIRRIPLLLPSTISLVSLYGFIILYSAAGGNINPWAYKQIMISFTLVPIIFLIAMLDIKIIYHFSYIFYFFTVIILIVVVFAGKTAMGATRWLDLGFITIQPSELVKISIILMLSRYFHNYDFKNSSDFKLVIPLFASIFPIMLVIKQPDLGTGMITLMVVLVMFLLAGVRIIYFILSGILSLALMPVIWLMLHDYQRNRVLTYLNPERDPLGTGYNIIQSKISIGSGGLFGKGLLSGTQGPLSFLPEYQTDFIFAFLAEELGFVGGIILLILYSLIIIQSLLISISCKSRFARLMCAGVTSLFFCHVFINIAMVMDLVPVVGVPLPLISYGRTMMASILIGFGLIMNAAVNSKNNI
ncbi:MAG: rod shape-determining protein RodA [Rickettsiales bacterium]|nr:MAG: rod shape-determining protein RodA [Rickettsiales bacterium]